MADTQTCSLNRSWTMKIGIFMIVLMGFGCWALLDALVLYPNRGLAAASVKFTEYLVATERAGRLTTERLTLADPKAEFARLQAKRAEIAGASIGDSSEARAAAMDRAKLEWLEALSTAWRLNTDIKPLGEPAKPTPRKLSFDMTKGEGFSTTPSGERAVLSPAALREELTAYWNSSNKPAPLTPYDLPVQWLFMVLGFGGGLYLLYLLVKCKSLASRHTFEPTAQRLSIPTGASFTPSDIEDIDKRLWHKYYVTILTKDNAQHKLDLLRYVPLEEWILSMERTRFPERAAEQDAAKAAQSDKSEDANPNT